MDLCFSMGLHVHACFCFFCMCMHMCILPPVVLLETELGAEFVDNGGASVLKTARWQPTSMHLESYPGFTYVLIIQK